MKIAWRTWQREVGKALGILVAATLAAAAVNALRPDPWPWIGAPTESVAKEITPDQITRTHGTLMFVDTRGPEEFARGHVAGAINWPADHAAENAGVADEWLSPQDQVVLYSNPGGENGDRLLSALLLQNGFDPKRVKVFSAGWQGLRELPGIPKVGE
jgi:rhodanese-related sulfurtransferase